MGNTFGKIFQISTWGESHGPAVGVSIDGCPAGVPIDVDEIQVELDRRRPGQSEITTPRSEEDRVEVLSGVFEGFSTGAPILLMVRNEDARPEAYDHLKDVYRPSHADYTYQAKYGRRDHRGGGRSSARETVGRVAAGSIARRILSDAAAVEIVAYVRRIHDIEAEVDTSAVTREEVESNPVRCPDQATAERMVERIKQLRKAGDSAGGIA